MWTINVPDISAQDRKTKRLRAGDNSRWTQRSFRIGNKKKTKGTKHLFTIDPRWDGQTPGDYVRVMLQDPHDLWGKKKEKSMFTGKESRSSRISCKG